MKKYLALYVTKALSYLEFAMSTNFLCVKPRMLRWFFKPTVAIIYLEMKDDGPYQSEGEFGIAVDDVLSLYVDQLDVFAL